MMWYDKKDATELWFRADGETFSAFYAAEKWLEDHGYNTGSMARVEPIGFSKKFTYIAKWYNINEDDKRKVDGVLLPKSEFREGDCLIRIFK